MPDSINNGLLADELVNGTEWKRKKKKNFVNRIKTLKLREMLQYAVITFSAFHFSILLSDPFSLKYRSKAEE